VKMLRFEADHSTLSRSQVTNARSYTSTPPYVFIVWCLIKQRIRLHGVVLSYAQGKLLTFYSYLHLYIFPHLSQSINQSITYTVPLVKRSPSQRMKDTAHD
jgi:hypothetical protein